MYTFLLAFALTYLLFIIIGAWRIAHDFATEDGPGGLYGTIRKGIKAWVEAQIDASDVADPANHHLYWLYYGIDCPHCLSFTTSLIVLLVATSPLTFPLAVWWGIAGLITLVNKFTYRA